MDFCAIIIQGHLDARRADSFAGLELRPLPGGKTMLFGLLRDQAELYGVLSQVRDLGITLISVHIIK